MSRLLVAATWVLVAAGCHLRAQLPTTLPPLADEAELSVYVQPLPETARRLTLSLESAGVVGFDGTVVPLQLELPRLAGKDGGG